MEKTRLCLLVDDDPDDQEVFCMALQEIDKNLKCIIANDGVRALEMLKSNNDLVPDFIFIDVNLPRMNGIDCLKHIKDLQHLKESEVIMYSTTSAQKILEKSKELGASDFIVKPAGFSMLREKLSAVLQKKATNEHDKSVDIINPK